MTYPLLRRRRVLSLLTGCSLLLAGADGLRAQAVAPGGTGTGPVNPTEGESPGSVEAGPDRVIVTDVPIEQSILPTTRPFTSAYGLDSNILDVPRNVTIISREQLDSITIQDVRDFSKLTSSSYTQSNFGAPANPSIRGLSADVFINGMREGLTNNGNGLPLNFNSVESVSILKGPAPVIYGASQLVGGFINLSSKRPYFDKFQGAVTDTVGEYDQYRWTLDFGGPIIKNKLAYRISYSGEESGSYYENGNKDTQAFYGALTWNPTDKLTIELNSEFFIADYTENFGLNRPTQDLINNNRYRTGFVGDVNGDGVVNANDVGSGFNFVTFGKDVTIDRSRRLLKEGDGSYGKSFNFQVIETYRASDNLTVVNNSFFNYVNRQTESSYYYSEILDDNFSVENRTEARVKFDIPIGGGKPLLTTKDGKDAKDAKSPAASEPFLIKNQINFGLDLRMQRVTAYNDFFNEPANVWDLSRSRTIIDYPDAQKLANGSAPVPGHPGRFFSPLNGDSGDSNGFVGGLFYQHDLTAGPFGLLFGGRGDLLYIDYHNPALGGAGDNTLHVLPNANVSPTYKILPWLTAYGTYNYSQSTRSGNGGGYVPSSGTQFSTGDLHQVSELFEAGLKASLLKDTLFLQTAVFNQSRTYGVQGGGSNDVSVNGVEFELNYQPTRNLYLTAAYTYLDATVNDVIPFSVNSYPVSALGAAGLTNTFGVISPYAKGDYKFPGLPPHLFNALATYKTDFGLGVTLGAVVTGPQNLNFDGSVKIPTQFTLDASVFYAWKNFEVRFSVLNCTDEENWSPPNPVYANDSVVADLPRRIEGTLKIRF